MITKELIESKIRDNIPLTKGEKIAWSNIRRTNPEIVITPSAEQVIIGSMLGDGSIVRKRTNCIFTFNHSLIQANYAFYKVNLLQKEGITMRYEEMPHSYRQGCINGRLIKDNGYARGIAETNIAFNKYRNEWYSPNKQVPDSIIRLAPLGLAIWYMDDGCINVNTSTQRSSIQHTCKIATCVDEKTINMIITYFKEIWNIKFRPFKEGKNTYSLATSSEEDCLKFVNIIKPYIEQVPSLLYKIRDNFTKEEFIAYQKTDNFRSARHIIGD